MRLAQRRHPRKPVAQVFLAALVLSGAWIGLLAYGAAQHGPTSRGAFVVDYHDRVLDDGLELLIIQSDGQAFATLARDPLLQRVTESFRTPEEAAYRSQRPLLGWLAAIGSLGRSGWVPPALAMVCALGAAASAAGAGALLAHRSRSPWLGLLVLVLPGTPLSLSILGAETLMLALLAWGLVAWERNRPGAAAVLFAVAVLSRETAILVPLGLGILALSRADWRRAGRLLFVPATLAAWYVVLRARVGAWPWAASEGRLDPPLLGLVEAAKHQWSDPSSQVAFVSLGLLLAVAAVVVAGRDHLTLVVGVHAAFALLLGRHVWADALHYGRVLLPMYVFASIAVAAGLTFGRGATPERSEHDRPVAVPSSPSE